MDFKENTSKIFAAHSKANAVIMSCKTRDQIEGATNYLNNFKRFCLQIKCANKLQRDFLVGAVNNLESTLKLKRKLLR